MCMTAGQVIEFMPAHYERLAVRLQPYRIRLAAVGMVSFALVLGAMFWAARSHLVLPPSSGPYVKVVFGVAWVVIVASWGLFLCVSWFQPSSWFRHRPTDRSIMRALRAAGRLWASFVLSLMFLVVPVPLMWFF
jgi:hypothetical protein